MLPAGLPALGQHEHCSQGGEMPVSLVLRCKNPPFLARNQNFEMSKSVMKVRMQSLFILHLPQYDTNTKEAV